MKKENPKDVDQINLFKNIDILKEYNLWEKFNKEIQKFEFYNIEVEVLVYELMKTFCINGFMYRIKFK